MYYVKNNKMKNNKMIIWEHYHEYIARKQWEEENMERIIKRQMRLIWGPPPRLCYNIPRILIKNINQCFVV